MLCTLIGAIILSINIQVGLNMHLYDDIGDASSSLRESTYSLKGFLQYIPKSIPSVRLCLSATIFKRIAGLLFLS